MLVFFKKLAGWEASARSAKFAGGKNPQILWELRRGEKNIEMLKSFSRSEEQNACGRQMKRPQTYRFALSAFFRNGRLLAFAIACAAYAFPLVAQESDVPNIAYVYPAGAKAGETVKITVGGRNFNGVTDVYITGEGIETGVCEVTVPLKSGNYFGLRNKLEEEFVKKHPEVVEEMKKFEDGGQAYLRKLVNADKEIMDKLAAADASVYLRKVSSDPMAETVEFEITVSPDAKKGMRNILVKSRRGLSNPARFVISDTDEFVKPSLRDTARKRIKLPANWGKLGIRSWVDPLMYPGEGNEFFVDMPVVVNGQITEAKTDAYSFYARKGDTVVIDVWGRMLLPYISDAVPGWFQPVVRVTDSRGKEVAYCDDFFHRPDPHLSFKIPENGVYRAEIFDAIYRSREDFVYRMSISTRPFVEYIFPIGGASGEDREFEVGGANLEKNKIKIDIPAGVGEFSPDFGCESIPELKIKYSPERCKLSAAESSKIVGGAAEILPSVTLNPPEAAHGRILKKGQRDSYKFDAAQGDKIVIETRARRLGSPIDTYLTVADSSGKILARADDFEDLSCGFVTAHTDSWMIFTPPFTGTFFVRVEDLTGGFSPAHAYRLEVRRPRPDFELRSVPSSLNFLPGRTTVFRVYAFRADGIEDYPIALKVDGLPEGTEVYGAEIPAGAKYADVGVKIPKGAAKKVFKMSVAGKADFPYGSIVRESVPCEDMMQAFYYRHYVPAVGMWGSVNSWNIFGRGFDAIRPDISKVATPIKIKRGGTVSIDVGASPAKFGNLPKAEFQDAPDGLSIKSFSIRNSRLVLEISCSENAKPAKGRFVVNLLGKHWRGMFLVDKIPPLDFEIE